MNAQQIQLGQRIPEFSLPSSRGGSLDLSQYRGHKVVLYFYPKDMTPACTKQACDFRDQSGAIEEAGAVVIGISADDIRSHNKFADKYNLSFPLLSDSAHKVSELFGVWQLKKLYGREYEGIVRSTFLIDEEGILIKEWRKVKTPGHAEEVLRALHELGSKP